jgi:uncharacterized protein (TIGR03067 family)
VKRISLALISVTCLSAFADDETAKKDLAPLQGAWKFTAYKGGSAEQAKDLIARGKIVFSGDTLTYYVGDSKIGAGKVKLDLAKKPAHFDVTTTDGSDPGRRVVGIIAIDGDTLKICSFNHEKKRPTTFEHKDDGPGFLATFKREKAKKK